MIGCFVSIIAIIAYVMCDFRLNPFKNIFDFTTAGDWDCVAAVERLPALHYSVDFIFFSSGSWVSLCNFETSRGSLMKPKWQKLARQAQEISIH